MNTFIDITFVINFELHHIFKKTKFLLIFIIINLFIIFIIYVSFCIVIIYIFLLFILFLLCNNSFFSRMDIRKIVEEFSKCCVGTFQTNTVREWRWCWKSDWWSTNSRNQKGDRSVSGRTSPTAESCSIGHLYLFFLLSLFLFSDDQTS